jgi:hypothetical protein
MASEEWMVFTLLILRKRRASCCSIRMASRSDSAAISAIMETDFAEIVNGGA